MSTHGSCEPTATQQPQASMRHRLTPLMALLIAPGAHAAVDGLRDRTGMVVLMVALLIPPLALFVLGLWLLRLLRGRRLAAGGLANEAQLGPGRRSSVSSGLGRLHVWAAATLFFFAISPVVSLGAMHLFERTAFINLLFALLSGALGIAYRTRLTTLDAGFVLLLVLSTAMTLGAVSAVLVIGVWSWRDLVAPVVLVLPLVYGASVHARN